MRNTEKSTAGLACVAAAIALGAMPAQAQIAVNWATKTLISSPTVINSKTQTTVTVSHVNDLLYSYKIEFTATPRAIDDAAGLLALVKVPAGGGAALTPTCEGNAATLQNNVSKVSGAMADIFDPKVKTTKDKDGKLISVPLQTTLDDWRIQVTEPWAADIDDRGGKAGSMAAVRAACMGTTNGDAALRDARELGSRIDAQQVKVSGAHEIVQNVLLAPETDYKITITESVGPDTTATFSASFSPQSNILTLSLGTLLSPIEQRSYSRPKDPANTQQELLSVDGTGRFSPLGVALLNYQIPDWWNSDLFGFALSSGVVIRFGGNGVTASSLGWFAGPSAHLYHRLFISAGVHIGQFADYPAGLHSGSIIPSAYGDLTPVNRTTARFAFALTYQTRSFSAGSTPVAPKTKTDPPVKDPAPAPGH